MKFNTRTITIISVLVFLVAFAVLYMNYTKQQNQKQTEQQTLASTNSNLAKVRSDKTSLDNQLAQVNSQIAQLQNQLSIAQQSFLQKKQSLPQPIDSINYGIILFDTAKRFSVDILSISTDGPQDNKVDNVTLSNISFALSLQGNLDDLQNLVHTLANEDPFRSATIESTNVSRVEETITETPVGGTTPVAITVVYHTMDLQITLYSNKGS